MRGGVSPEAVIEAVGLVWVFEGENELLATADIDVDRGGAGAIGVECGTDGVGLSNVGTDAILSVEHSQVFGAGGAAGDVGGPGD